MKQAIFFFFCFCLAASAAWAQIEPYDYGFGLGNSADGQSESVPATAPGSPEMAGASYIVSAGNTVEISVYDEPDLSKTVRVSENGTITFPFIGEIRIAGLTAEEAAGRIADGLRGDYLINPQVSLFIREYSKFFVLGSVNREGGYELRGPYSVIDAIALAGGAKENANLSRIKVIRREQDKDVETTIDFETQAKDFLLRPYDRIMVEEYGVISVLGEVNQPKSFYPKKGFTLLDAVALAGGFKENANVTEIKIIRKTQEGEQVSVVNLDTQGGSFLLEEKDVLYVKAYGNFTVIGQVKAPGTYYLKRGLTVVDAIALAGGFTGIASENAVKVIRTENGRETSIEVPVDSILRSGKGSDRSRNIPVREGDTIVVPESLF